MPSTATIPILLLKSPSTSPSPSAAPSTSTSTSTSPTPSPADSSYTTIFPFPQYKTLHVPPLSTTPLFDTLLTFLSSLSSFSSSSSLAASPSIPTNTNTNPNPNTNTNPSPAIPTISALIFTSQRAVSSLSSLLSLLSSSSSSSSSSTTAPPTALANSAAATNSTPSILLLAPLRSLRIPIFVVGRATASAVQKTLIDGPEGWMGGCWVEGEEAGTGEALAGIILHSLKARARRCRRKRCERWTGEEEGGSSTIHQTETETRERGDGGGGGDADQDGNKDGDKDENKDADESGNENENSDISKPHKVIFITGETRRDIIPRFLREGGVTVEEIIVYKTRVDDKFEAEFKKVLWETEALTRTSGVRWIVVFSGQGAREMLRGLGWLDENGRVKEEGWSDEKGRVKGEEERREGGKDDISSRSSHSHNGSRRRRSTFVASIGPTTAEYLKTEFGLQVDVCAEKPTGEALREGIERFMRQGHHECFSSNMTTPAIEKSRDFI